MLTTLGLFESTIISICSADENTGETNLAGDVIEAYFSVSRRRAAAVRGLPADLTHAAATTATAAATTATFQVHNRCE